MRTPQSHTALENPPSQSTLEDLRMPVQTKLHQIAHHFEFPGMRSGRIGSAGTQLSLIRLASLWAGDDRWPAARVEKRER
jgi:hypothetical protein